MRRFLVAIAVSIAFVGLSAAPASAATPGSWTGWTYNSGSGCSTRAQVPRLSSGWVVGAVEVYCPSSTWLSVRGRLRSDRTFSDVTVGSTGCAAWGTCPVLQPAGYRTYSLYNDASHCPGSHGYHTDVIIFPGTNSFRTTGSTSGSTDLSPACYR